MPRQARNNPRQIRIKSCGCPLCTAKFRPGDEPSRKNCTGPWQARYRDPGGRQRAKTFNGENAKRRAEAFLDSTRDKVRTGSFVDADRGQITLADWYAKWSATRRIGPTAQVRAESVWSNHVEPHFGSWPIASIGNLDIEEWVAKLATRAGRATISQAFQMVDRMMAAAVRDRRIVHNPCDGVQLPKPQQRHPDDLLPPTYAQLAAIRAQMPAHYHPLLVVAEETGLRWGELAGLRRCWVDLENAELQVRETVIQVRGVPQRKPCPKSGAGFRTVPLSVRAVEALRGHLEKHPAKATRTSPASGLHPEELVFRSPQAGRQLPKTKTVYRGVMDRANMWRLWREAAEAAGVARQTPNPVTGRMEWWPHVHEVRHAFASRLHSLGVSEADAQRILGHERGARITWLYTHASSGAVDSIRDILNGGGAESGRDGPNEP